MEEEGEGGREDVPGFLTFDSMFLTYKVGEAALVERRRRAPLDVECCALWRCVLEREGEFRLVDVNS